MARGARPVEVESATFWKDGPEIETGELRTEDIGPRSSSCPPPRTPRRTARSRTPSACCSGTTRRSSRRATAGRSCGSCSTWAGACARSSRGLGRPERDRPMLDLTWDYPTEGPHDEPDAEAVLREISGFASPTGRRSTAITQLAGRRLDRLRLLDLLRRLRRRAQPGGAAQAAARSRRWVAPEWGWAWPMNRRILYNRASADPDGRPWSERKRYVWWDAEAGQVDGRRRARLRARQAARLRARRRTRRRRRRCAATSRSSCRPTARAGCSRPAGSSTGRCPRTTSRTSRRSQPALRAAGQPGAPAVRRAPTTATTRDRAPSASRSSFTTYRITEHHTAGGMSRCAARTCPSCSPSSSSRSRPSWPRCAGSSTAAGRRSSTRARRGRGARAGHRPDHAAARRRPRRPPDRAALPLGRATASPRGDSANDLLPLALDPNVHIRRVQGRDLRHPARPPAARPGAAALVDDYRRAGGAHERPARLEPAAASLRRRGAAARGLLHRHVAVHRLQGVRGRVQGVEPGARGRPEFLGESMDNTRRAGRRHVAPRRRSSSSGRRAGTRRWHFRWLMCSDVCKHCTHAACLEVCPTGALFRTEFGTVVVQEDVCNGCGYCVPACPFGVIDRREEDGRVWKCTLCYDRLRDGQEPACAKACPTDSIQFGELEELRVRGAGPRGGAAGRGVRRGARSTATTRTTASAAPARSSCCSTTPRSTACRRTRSSTDARPARHVAWQRHAALAAGALVAGVRGGALVGAERGERPRPRSYYGQPVLKPPVWTPEIPCVLLRRRDGGRGRAAGAGRRDVGPAPRSRRAAGCSPSPASGSRRSCSSPTSGGPSASTTCCGSSRSTSPMSVGSWALAGFGTGDRDRGRQRAARACRAARRPSRSRRRCGPVVSTYTAALIADTAVPVWHEARTRAAVRCSPPPRQPARGRR